MGHLWFLCPALSLSTRDTRGGSDLKFIKDVAAGQRKEQYRSGAAGPPQSQPEQGKLWRSHLPVLVGIPHGAQVPTQPAGVGGAESPAS